MQWRRKKNGNDDRTQHPVQVFGQQRRRLYHHFGTSWNGRSSKRVLRQFAGSEKYFNSKWCTVVPSILMERDNDKVATAWSYWEEVAAEHQNKLVQVLPLLQRALPPDLCCVPLIKLPLWLFWSFPLCMTMSFKIQASTSPFQPSLANKKDPYRNLLPMTRWTASRPLLQTLNSKLSFFSWCVALRYTCDVWWLQPEEKRQTVCQWASLATLLGNVGVFRSLSPFFWKTCLLFKNIFLNDLMVFFDLSYFCFNNIVTQMHHLLRIIHRFVRCDVAGATTGAALQLP